MPIPNDEVIQRELLTLLYNAREGRMDCSIIYVVLAKLHPELTHFELNNRYQNSKSKWANRVQFARLHLVQRGLIFKAGCGPSPSRGVWIITESGRNLVSNGFL